jgi:nitronate monooxygenase
VILDDLRTPVVLAPLAGGPSTPELAAAVSEAGGFGFLALGYLSVEAARDQIAATRGLTDRPFGVNVFSPVPGPTDPAAYEAYVARLNQWAGSRGAELGEPRHSDDDFEEKLELLAADPVAAVSFTFGCPTAEVVDRLHAAGSEVWVTVTNPDEAAQATSAGADALVVQGIEAGGHRGSFADGDGLPGYGLLSLLQLVAAQESAGLVASGGIATGGALAAVLAAGARAAQIGTAFMLCPEAGTRPAHREALRSSTETSLTRAFTGRTARGIRNEFMAEHDAEAPVAYPEIHYLTAPLRRAARERGDASVINLWAGETHALARELPTADLVRQLMNEARAAGTSAADRLRPG